MKRVKIYGLPRSGTNYLEYLVRENLECIYEPVERESKYLDQVCMEKHCEPWVNDADLVICIYRVHGWLDSIEKWRPSISREHAFAMQCEWIRDAGILRGSRDDSVMMIQYGSFLGDESGLLRLIHELHEIPLKNFPDFKIPMYRMEKNNGLTMTNEKFPRP